ncbi:XTP/dITP diphosphatase [Aquibacillus koreensis]|uniref:dITP/XTP pyrophosphatase n=1 Tax=Aquibacillus koreensis TaxID=279446 RepID=A0A9X3WL96_9BACI|nr:XTP/dITP diphosphatase [Aquibacillus koreensis]MCT2537918.1 XTP/dITP diphosphatase [Aquibacillus koreensis]MDC3419191.1 XTP/dITP diphosphatase [Aquibacillus koreensis]
MQKLIIATKNKGKMKDFNQLFSKYGIEVLSLLDLEEDIPDIEETGDTFEENAAIKAEVIAKKFHLPVLADDSGLEVDALGGEPGVYSARYAGTHKDDNDNLHKVLEKMTGVKEEKRTARFVCVLALAQPEKATIYKRGECEGHIGVEPVGENGFGYDPIFIPNNYNKTMAELTSEEKNQISHRRNALIQLEEWIKEN